VKKYLSLLIFLQFLNGKELFTLEEIGKYLNNSNPFISTIYNKESVAKEQIQYYQGEFDTKISGKYENKDYPASSGEYYEIFAKKGFENGLNLFSGYRASKGVQEFNNIKTSDDGEILLGLKIPLTEVFKGLNSPTIDLEVAKLKAEKLQFYSKNSLRLLNFAILKSYYTLLYNYQIHSLNRELLKKAEDRVNFISKKVKGGLLAEISLLEANQQIVDRKQLFLSSKISFENSLRDFVIYLNISKDDFLEKYFLEEKIEIVIEDFKVSELIEFAKNRRPDLEMLKFNRDIFQKEREKSSLLKYPHMNLSLYGVHDLKYGNGFKVSFDLEFPIESSKYESKMGEFKREIENVSSLEEKIIFEIVKDLENVANSINGIKESLEIAQKEIELVSKLEISENRKFSLGGSDLFMLNQREMKTLTVKKKVLEYKVKYLILKEELKNIIGY
jgi:outer membrane protein TolC